MDAKKDIIRSINNQQLATIGGLIVYPLIAIITKHPPIALFSIPCCSVHIKAIYDLHKMYGSVLYNQRGFGDNKYFSIKGNNVKYYKVDGFMRTKIEPASYNKSKIPHSFLSNSSQKLVDEIVDMRKIRFRSALTISTISTVTLNFTYYIIFSFNSPITSLLIGIFIGNSVVQGITFKPISNSTDNLFLHIKKERNEEFKHFKKKYVYVDIYGNIINTNEKPLWRKHMKIN